MFAASNAKFTNSFFISRGRLLSPKDKKQAKSRDRGNSQASVASVASTPRKGVAYRPTPLKSVWMSM